MAIILNLSTITLNYLESLNLDGKNETLKNTTIAVPLNYLSYFWKTLEMPLINCKVELKLKWMQHYLV